MAVTTPPSPRVTTRVGVLPAAPRTPRSGTALILALVAACAYAVFAHGAVGLPEEPRLQVGLAVIAIVAAVGWLLSGTLRLRAPAIAWLGVALLALFAVWCGVTMLWSVTPDRTWAHINRAAAYTLVVVLAIAAGSSALRAIERVAIGWLVVAVVCALYALAGKVIPGVSLLGLDFNQTASVSRLRAPLEYWNALGLVCVLAIPIALRLAADGTRRVAIRMASLEALFVLLSCLAMTYSRGGIMALVVAVAVMTALGGLRLRVLAVLSVTLLFTLPVIGLAFTRPALKGLNVPLDERIPTGIVLGLVMAGCLLGLLIVGWWLLGLEKRTTWTAARTRNVWRGLAVAAGLLGSFYVAAIVTTDGGPRGVADRAWETFTATSKDDLSDPARISTANSGNRWVWWEEAAGAWSERPLHGWGAGSFPVTHKMFRQEELGVVQPHNVPLQFLAETGLIGALLALGALGVLLFTALDRVRAMAPGRQRDIAVALYAGAVAWLVHGLVDWDWDIPGVTVPALLFLGVLVAVPREVAWSRLPTEPPERPVGLRAAALAAACVVLGLAIVSASLPSWAESKSDAALVVSKDAAEQELKDKTAEAELAARLDPTSARPLLIASALAQNRGRLLDARRYLLRAVERQPYNAGAWARLLQLSMLTADRSGVQAAGRRLLELDPISTSVRQLASRLALFSIPAAASPTATGTPLSPKYTPAAATTTTPPAGTGPAAGTR
ncbi:MAG: O-antigen ligase family protein [Actinobacteria bacterium]|nr:O-antigen ligase family protein [Actinomycetota bacterium]